jgi:hypothetical protein
MTYYILTVWRHCTPAGHWARTWAPGSPGYSPGLGPPNTSDFLLNFRNNNDNPWCWVRIPRLDTHTPSKETHDSFRESTICDCVGIPFGDEKQKAQLFVYRRLTASIQTSGSPASLASRRPRLAPPPPRRPTDWSGYSTRQDATSMPSSFRDAETVPCPAPKRFRCERSSNTGARTVPIFDDSLAASFNRPDSCPL